MKFVLLKKKMLDKGREDFTQFLAEILGISVPSASRKLKGEVKFSVDDMQKVEKALNLTPTETYNIFF